jgi:hypothetical protein
MLGSVRRMDRMDLLVAAIGAMAIAMVCLLAAVTIDRCCAAAVPAGTAVVVSKGYVPSSVSTGLGSDKDGNSQVITQYSSEQWFVVVQRDSDAHPITCSSTAWAAVSVGDTVPLTKLQGAITTYGYRLAH